MNTTGWGFIEPLAALADLSGDEVTERLGIVLNQPQKTTFGSFRGTNSVFDEIAVRAASFLGRYEDQCSAKYYYDLFNCVRAAYGEVNRLIEVGVYLGGASVILAGCAARMDMALDLVDVNPAYLRFSHERIRRAFPDQAQRVRLFLGDLPSYVRNVLLKETGVKAMVQHDGAHDFNQVVRDLSSLYYARDRLHSLAIQDTQLRGKPPHFNFVDAAVYAVFGFELSFVPLGSTYGADNPLMTTPNRFEGNYFLPDRPEGMYLTMSGNKFCYPHPSISIDAFLPAA